MKVLTHRQQEVLSFIEGSIRERGFPPTIREIGLQLGIRSTNGVNDHLKALERKGHLRREDLKSRAIRPVSASEPATTRNGSAAPPRVDWVEIPILGRVAAGQPILAVEEAEDSVYIDRTMVNAKGREIFALRVAGESMIEDGILDGDFVFVCKAPCARAGEIVIALIDGEATCKRYFPERDRIRFQPGNASMQPIYVNRSAFRETMILGTVTGVYRRL